MANKNQKRQNRKAKIRGKISGTKAKPRLTVFRSNSHIYAQLIDDENNVTIVGASDIKIDKGTNIEKAEKVGTDIATKAKAKKITTAVFDRNGYKYHGRIKTLADAARKAGLKF